MRRQILPIQAVNPAIEFIDFAGFFRIAEMAWSLH
jgi:hypothetical protein